MECSAGQPVAATVDQYAGRGQPPRLEGELGQLVTLDPGQPDHDPAEPTRGELDLERLRALGDQRELLGDGLLEADRARRRLILASAHGGGAVLPAGTGGGSG